MLVLLYVHTGCIFLFLNSTNQLLSVTTGLLTPIWNALENGVTCKSLITKLVYSSVIKKPACIQFLQKCNTDLNCRYLWLKVLWWWSKTRALDEPVKEKRLSPTLVCPFKHCNIVQIMTWGESQTVYLTILKEK